MSHPTITKTARCLTLIASPVAMASVDLIGSPSLIKHSAVKSSIVATRIGSVFGSATVFAP